MKNNRPQAKDISDDQIVAARDACATRQQQEGDKYRASRPLDEVWARTQDIQAELSVFPPKVVLAKLRRMVERGIMDGCSCGCRGDWVVLKRPAKELPNEPAVSNNSEAPSLPI